MNALLLALVCIAVASATEHLEEVGDNDRPLVRCKRPMCDPPCQSGYAYDQRGCLTCECRDKCEKIKCGPYEVCKEVGNVVQCVNADSGPVPIQPLPCPVPMCAMEHECEFGFKNNEHGCQTCTCRDTPCDSEKCPEGEICTEHKVKCDKDFCPNQPKCVGKPLCNRQAELHSLTSSLLMPGPALFDSRTRNKRQALDLLECDASGDFKPLQCDATSVECWCVDDRGLEIPETRTYSKPDCHYNKTRKVHGSFKLTHSLENVTPHMSNIKQLAHQHLSHWLHMDEEFVNIVEITPWEMHIIQVRFEVISDEETDMATAVYHVQYLMLNGRCQINYQGGTLVPVPKTMEVHHHYAPQLPDESGWTGHVTLNHHHGFMGFVHRHQTGIIAAVFGATMLILLFAIISFARRRKMNAPFNHRRMGTYKENLAFSNQLYGKQALMPDEIKEPLPEVEVSPASGNKTLDSVA